MKIPEIDQEETRKWYKDDVLHREDSPAISIKTYEENHERSIKKK